MDSTSKTQATPAPAELYLARIPSLSTSSSSGYSIPIRAPPTLGSHFEYSKKQKNSISSYSTDSDDDYNSVFYESEGFVSGEDGFETASETPYPGDETLGQSFVSKGNVVSRPFVNNPDEKEKEKEKEKEIVDSDDDIASRIPREEEVKNSFARVQAKSVIGMPIAQLSADSDDDSVSSVGTEDDGISVPVRVPSVGLVKELNSAPKVKIVELERKEEDEWGSKTFIKPEMNEDLTSGDVVDGVSGCQTEGVYEDDSVWVDAVDDKALDATQEAETESSEDVKYAVEDKEVVVEDTETRNDLLSAGMEANENAVCANGVDVAYVTNETNLHGIGLEHGFNRQIVPTSDEETETDEENERQVLFDSAELAALFEAAPSTELDGGGIMLSAANGSRIFSLERPPGLGSTIHSFRPTILPNCHHEADDNSESEHILGTEDERWLEKIQQIRVKFLRLVKRLGFSSEYAIARRVLHQLGLASGVASSVELGLESAMETELEGENKNDSRFSLNILVIGKTGVGKSATINSIFGEEKRVTNAFEPETNAVKEIVGTKDGIEFRVLDTPGLRSSITEHSSNMKILLSIKRYMKKCPPDVVLYVDRVDSQTSGLTDLPLLKSITSSLGPSIWDNAIVTLTHAASTPLDGPSGFPISYEMLVAQRSQVMQKLISHTLADPLGTDSVLMNSVAVVENHPCCKKNGGGEFLLPNGESWRPELVLLCYSMKILSELNSLLKTRESSDFNKISSFRMRSPPLSYLLPSLLKNNINPKLLPDHDGEESEFYYLSDFNEKNEDEYIQLPPFKPLRKTQNANLSKEQRDAYFKEHEYWVKLLQKKQLRQIKNRSKDKNAIDDDQEMEGPSTLSAPFPDTALPPSFDGDYSAYRCRNLEFTSQILIRPVLNSCVWGQKHGYDGVGLDQYSAIANRSPAVILALIIKDKKEFNDHLDSTVSSKLCENCSIMAGIEFQPMGKKELAYVLKGETEFKNLKKNKAAAGMSVTFIGENVVTGLKIEDQLVVGKRLVIVGTTGAVGCGGDLAYGSNLELRVRERDFPIGHDESRVGLSLVWFNGELIWGCNLQSKFCVGRDSKMTLQAGLNNKGKRKISIKTNFLNQLQIALVVLLPIFRALSRKMFPISSKEKSVE